MGRFYAWETEDPVCIWGIGYSPYAARCDAEKQAGSPVEGDWCQMSEGAYNFVKKNGFASGRVPDRLERVDDKWVLKPRARETLEVPVGFVRRGSYADKGASAIGREVVQCWIGPRGGIYYRFGSTTRAERRALNHEV